MPFAPHTRLSFGGPLVPTGEAPEIWNCNLNVVSNDGGGYLSPDEIQAVGTHAQTALNSFWVSTASFISPAAFLEYLKIANIQADGSYDPASPYVFNMNGGNGTSNTPSPDILTVSYTWTTATARGVGSKGRIFLPNTYQNKFPSSMRIASGSTGFPSVPAHIIAAVNLMGALCGVPAAGVFPLAKPVVASNVDATLHPITGVKIGDVCDVQRRRKNALKEVYTSAAF